MWKIYIAKTAKIPATDTIKFGPVCIDHKLPNLAVKIRSIGFISHRSKFYAGDSTTQDNPHYPGCGKAVNE